MIDFKTLTADQLAEYEDYHFGDLVARLHYFSSVEATKEQYHLVAIDDGAPGAPIIGIVGLQNNPDYDDEVWFKHVSVDERYRNQGIGRTLVRMAMEHARDHDRRLKFSDFERESVRDMVYRLAEWFPDVEMVTTDERPIVDPEDDS